MDITDAPMGNNDAVPSESSRDTGVGGATAKTVEQGNAPGESKTWTMEEIDAIVDAAVAMLHETEVTDAVGFVGLPPVTFPTQLYCCPPQQFDANTLSSPLAPQPPPSFYYHYPANTLEAGVSTFTTDTSTATTTTLLAATAATTLTTTSGGSHSTVTGDAAAVTTTDDVTLPVFPVASAKRKRAALSVTNTTSFSRVFTTPSPPRLNGGTGSNDALWTKVRQFVATHRASSHIPSSSSCLFSPTSTSVSGTRPFVACGSVLRPVHFPASIHGVAATYYAAPPRSEHEHAVLYAASTGDAVSLAHSNPCVEAGGEQWLLPWSGTGSLATFRDRMVAHALPPTPVIAYTRKQHNLHQANTGGGGHRSRHTPLSRSHHHSNYGAEGSSTAAFAEDAVYERQFLVQRAEVSPEARVPVKVTFPNSNIRIPHFVELLARKSSATLGGDSTLYHACFTCKNKPLENLGARDVDRNGRVNMLVLNSELVRFRSVLEKLQFCVKDTCLDYRCEAIVEMDDHALFTQAKQLLDRGETPATCADPLKSWMKAIIHCQGTRSLEEKSNAGGVASTILTPQSSRHRRAGESFCFKPPALTSAQTAQLLDAFYWTNIASEETRILEGQCILDFWKARGVYVVLKAPHRRTGEYSKLTESDRKRDSILSTYDTRDVEDDATSALDGSEDSSSTGVPLSFSPPKLAASSDSYFLNATTTSTIARTPTLLSKPTLAAITKGKRGRKPKPKPVTTPTSASPTPEASHPANEFAVVDAIA